MTFEEILADLPNGLHDARLESLKVDYSRGRLEMDLDVWVGDLSAPPGEEREAMRRGRLTFTGLVGCIIEPPEGYEASADSPSIDAGILPGAQVKPPFQLSDLPAGVMACWFFIDPTNSFIYVVARDAQIQWTGPRRRPGWMQSRTQE